MIEVITMNDGERVFICSDRDILEVVEQYCGYDFMKFIENKLEDKSEERTALDEELRSAEMEWEQLRDCIFEISSLIQQYQDELDRGERKFSRKSFLPLLDKIIDQINEVL